VVDCQGVPQGAMMTSTSLGLSLFYVSTAGTEPELSCIGSARNSQPVIRGVESLQVVYGIDASVGGSLTTSSIPNRWVSAQDVPDWNRVRAVRVGLVLRGAPGTSQAQQAGSNDLYPLGEDFSAGNTEAGIKFTPPADGRLRRAFAATFMLRNRL
jgi:type IV pilus assembly protein PilW